MSERSKSFRIPGVGRLGMFHESAGMGAGFVGTMGAKGHLSAQVIRNGQPLEARKYMGFWGRFWGNIRGDALEVDLGSGLITNVGVNMMTWNDEASVLGASMSLFNFHAIGTGATAAAAADYYLQTPQGTTNLSGTTNGYMTGAQTVVAPNIYQTVATFTATGAIAVTEWVLTMSNAVNFSRTSTGTPTSTTFPDSGAAFTTAGNGLKGWTIETGGTSAVNTPTTTVAGLVTANTATSLTIAEGWWTLANAAGSTPGVNAAYVVYPTALDHKVFAAINLANGDSLQVTYKLTNQSGG